MAEKKTANIKLDYEGPRYDFVESNITNLLNIENTINKLNRVIEKLQASYDGIQDDDAEISMLPKGDLIKITGPSHVIDDLMANGLATKAEDVVEEINEEEVEIETDEDTDEDDFETDEEEEEED